MTRKRLSIVLIAIAALVALPAAAPAAGGGSAGRFPADGFRSPDGKTWCQGTAGEVGCVSFRGGASHGPAHGAVLRRGGHLVICPEESAGPGWSCFQNFDATAPVLAYGRWVKGDGFRCASTRQGITCVLTASGRGFRIDDEGAVPIR